MNDINLMTAKYYMWIHSILSASSIAFFFALLGVDKNEMTDLLIFCAHAFSVSLMLNVLLSVLSYIYQYDEDFFLLFLTEDVFKRLVNLAYYSFVFALSILFIYFSYSLFFVFLVIVVSLFFVSRHLHEKVFEKVKLKEKEEIKIKEYVDNEIDSINRVGCCDINNMTRRSMNKFKFRLKNKVLDFLSVEHGAIERNILFSNKNKSFLIDGLISESNGEHVILNVQWIKKTSGAYMLILDSLRDAVEINSEYEEYSGWRSRTVLVFVHHTICAYQKDSVTHFLQRTNGKVDVLFLNFNELGY